eukprot:1655231-Ditylum_brightwellii.AAC.1
MMYKAPSAVAETTKTPSETTKMPHIHDHENASSYEPKMPQCMAKAPSMSTTPPLATKIPVPFDIEDKDGHQLMPSIICQAQQERWEKSLGK